MGDFNAKVGQPKLEEHRITGKHGYGSRNQRGELLINYCLEKNLAIMNTYFMKKSNRKWTWIAPNGRTKNEVDFILTNQKQSITNIEIINKIEFSSDHRLVRATWLLKQPKKSRINFRNKTTKSLQTDIEKDDFLKRLEEERQPLMTLAPDELTQLYHDRLINCIQTSLKHSQKNNHNTQKSILSDTTKQLITKRTELQNIRPKTKEIKSKLSDLYKKVSKSIKEDYKKHRESKIENHIYADGSVKKAYKELRTHKNWIPKLQISDNNTALSRNQILETATTYYRKLYSSQEQEPPKTDLPSTSEVPAIDEIVIMRH
ncbi:uncharacterized protein LOC134798200 [Cydia splendana]|uniref:uncharacterized protein LOC134798200 n=1 Tax=Cydia splendana TaxID=1100963 RepID=UPI00300C8275